MNLHLVRYSKDYLDRSFHWLSDPETKFLTMTPDFTRASQTIFFQSIEERTDYKIWGVELEGRGPIGASGIKRISEGSGEYWGYIGEKDLWNQGLGKLLLAAVEAEALKLRLHNLTLMVSKQNPRAIHAYSKAGYEDRADHGGTMEMFKCLT